MADCCHCLFVFVPGVSPRHPSLLLLQSAASLTLRSTCTSSIYSLTYEQLMDEFHCSQEVATLGLSLFVLGLAFGPIFLAPLSEVPFPAPA